MFSARYPIRGIGTLSVKCGDSNEIAAYKGPKGELAINIDNNCIHVQDGETPGGILVGGGGGGGGMPGPPGKDGKDGVDGKSAYELAVDDGYRGTLAEWLLSLHGQDGAPGTNGTDGAPGKDGADGKDGKDGTNGAAATITIGKVSTLPPGSQVSVVNTGTPNEAVLDIGIPEGTPGQTGAVGADGLPGAPGADGAAATIAIGTVNAVPSSSPAKVTNRGTSNAALFDFEIPQGAQGEPGTAATVTVGTVTTGAAGTQVSVTNRGTASNAVLDFIIPRGADGSDHGVPDVLVASAASATYPAGVETKIRFSTENTNIGDGFRLENGELVCQKAGYILVIARASTTPPSGATGNAGYTRLYLNVASPGGTYSLVAVDARTVPGIANSAYNEVCRLFSVVAGQRFQVELYPDIARTGTALLCAAYLSANGLSAYEVAKKNGFNGTEQEWLEKVQTVLIGEPEYDWGAAVAQTVTTSTANNYLSAEGVASVSGMLRVRFSASSTAVSTHNRSYGVYIDSALVDRRSIIAPNMENDCIVPISQGQTFRFYGYADNINASTLSIFIAPVKAVGLSPYVDDSMDGDSERPLMNKTITNLYAQIYDDINQCVSLAGADEISGQKTFTSAPRILANGPTVLFNLDNLEKGTAPTGGNRHAACLVNDKDGTGETAHRLGGWMTTVEQNTGLVSTNLYAYQNAASTNVPVSIGVSCSADGTEKYGTAPTPSADSNTTHIATTAWVRSYMPAPVYSTAEQFTGATYDGFPVYRRMFKSAKLVRPSSIPNIMDIANLSSWNIRYMIKCDFHVFESASPSDPYVGMQLFGGSDGSMGPVRFSTQDGSLRLVVRADDNTLWDRVLVFIMEYVKRS